MNSPKFTKYSSKIENYDKHKWAAVHGLRHSIARFALAPQLPLLSLQYTRCYIQDGIIGKTSSIDFWTKAQQPINLSPIFARHWHHISICCKPFHVNQQARCLESFKSTSRMILRASFNGLMVESYLSRLFCFAMVCRSTVRHSSVCRTPFASKITVIVIAGPLVLNIMTSNRFQNICPAWDGVCGNRATFLMKDEHFHFPDFLTI